MEIESNLEGGPPSSTYLVNACIEQHNRVFGAIYGGGTLRKERMRVVFC